MPLSAVIVEDEPTNREGLLQLLKDYCPDVTVVDAAESVPTGLQAIRKHQPDLLFLDVEMPGQNGFDLLQQVGDINFEVIFTTAYDKYALQAIKVSALDFLLKPIDINELTDAVQKVHKKRNSLANDPRFSVFLDNLAQRQSSHQSIALPTKAGFDVVKINEVLYCQADGNYVWFYMINGDKKLISRTMKEYDGMLTEHGFYRIHHSYLVNTNHIKAVNREAGGSVTLEDGTQLDISKRRKEAFFDYMLKR